MKRVWHRLVGLIVAMAVLLSAFSVVSFVSAQVTEVKTAQEYLAAVNADAFNTEIEIKLMKDIELISDTEATFSGTIDGNGHTITLKSGTALFENLKGTVKNLGVIVPEGYIIDAPDNDYVGILANYISGSVENCFVYGTIDADFSSNSNTTYVGGLCGSVTETGSITNSFSLVSIKTKGADYVGGFVGIVRNNGKDSAEITSCYSAGDIDADGGWVAGFANKEPDASVSDTYTTCQIKNMSNNARPSGVNGLYDNQLGLMRESFDNGGLKTLDLMKTAELSASFAVTSTTYPALRVFYEELWSPCANDVVALSVAATAFKDQDPTARKEPSDMYARADYLTINTDVYRTNSPGLSWYLDSKHCKILDTVPLTSYNSAIPTTAIGTSPDLLEAHFEFDLQKETQEDSVLYAKKNGLVRRWHLHVDTQNPYYPGNDGSANNSFAITDRETLDLVRHYSWNTFAYYTIINPITFNNIEFDPIIDFYGHLDGQSNILSNLTLTKNRDGAMGLFGSTKPNSTITRIALQNVTAISENGQITGALIGEANGTAVSVISMHGTNNTVSSSGTVGGLIGKANASTFESMLVSVEADGSTVGGLIGILNDGSLRLSGSTGFIGSNASVLGGIVGEMSGVAGVSDCYSTAVVISDTDKAIAGGLIGIDNSSSVVQNSYSAALTDAATRHPLVGQGTQGTNCFFDEQFYPAGVAVGAVSAATLINTKISDSWTITNSNYPQLSLFSGSNLTERKQLSDYSTMQFKYQQHWEDSVADNLTTGWISNANFAKPEAIESLNIGGTPLIYNVSSQSGYGFEAASGQKRLVLKSTDKSKLYAVRYVAAIRDDSISLSYEVVGDGTLKDAPRTYIEISYGSKDSWSVYQVMSVCDDANTYKTLYDIPSGSQIRVRVFNADAYKATVAVNSEACRYSNGYYETNYTYNTAVKVTITLSQVTPPWGVHKQTY